MKRKSELPGAVSLLCIVLGIIHFAGIITVTHTYNSNLWFWFAFHVAGVALCASALALGLKYDDRTCELEIERKLRKDAEERLKELTRPVLVPFVDADAFLGRRACPSALHRVFPDYEGPYEKDSFSKVADLNGLKVCVTINKADFTISQISVGVNRICADPPDIPVVASEVADVVRSVLELH